jgi:hypothetical protein
MIAITSPARTSGEARCEMGDPIAVRAHFAGELDRGVDEAGAGGPDADAEALELGDREGASLGLVLVLVLFAGAVLALVRAFAFAGVLVGPRDCGGYGQRSLGRLPGLRSRRQARRDGPRRVAHFVGALGYGRLAPAGPATGVCESGPDQQRDRQDQSDATTDERWDRAGRDGEPLSERAAHRRTCSDGGANLPVRASSSARAR